MFRFVVLDVDADDVSMHVDISKGMSQQMLQDASSFDISNLEQRPLGNIILAKNFNVFLTQYIFVENLLLSR